VLNTLFEQLLNPDKLSLQSVNDARLRERDLTLSVLRLDTLDPTINGNKPFKLWGHLQPLFDQTENMAAKPPKVLSFGGAFSNHIHALAALGQRTGLQTIGVIRGERPRVLSPTLQDAERWGMQLVFCSRADYRRRETPDFLAALQQRYGPCLLVPEGGSGPEGADGCRQISQALLALANSAPDYVCLPCGSAGTAAGVWAGLPPGIKVEAVSVLKGARDLDQRVRDYRRALVGDTAGECRVHHQFHCGGYAKSHESLRAFIADFQRDQGIPLEPVYSGKLFYALFQLIDEGYFPVGSHLVALHTGGLQGARPLPSRNR